MRRSSKSGNVTVEFSNFLNIFCIPTILFVLLFVGLPICLENLLHPWEVLARKYCSNPFRIR